VDARSDQGRHFIETPGGAGRRQILIERERRAGLQEVICRCLFDFIELIMPRTRIAKGFRGVAYLRAFLPIQIFFETDLTVPALEFVYIVVVIGVFDMEFFTAADRAFGFGHNQPSFNLVFTKKSQMGDVAAYRIFETAVVAAHRQGFQKPENTDPGRNMPFIGG
jgi:hypothetical protein